MVTLDELKDKLASNARLIGLDLGTKRIGIAICDDKRKIASPYKTIEYKNMDYLVNELKNIIKDNNIFCSNNWESYKYGWFLWKKRSVNKRQGKSY